jgi:hypothetical protein
MNTRVTRPDHWTLCNTRVGPRLRMRSAKLRIRNYLMHNRYRYDPKTVGRKVNWEIVKLSHRVYNGHTGLRGHMIRQRIRRSLWSSVGGKARVYRRAWGNRRYEYNRRPFQYNPRPPEHGHHRFHFRKSYAFLTMWVTIFLVGLYLIPALNLYLLLGESFFNALVLFVVVYGILGMTHRGAGHKIFAVLLLLLIFGLAYQNQSAVANLNADSVMGVFQAESSYFSTITAWSSSLSLPSSSSSNLPPGTSQTGQNSNPLQFLSGPTIDGNWVQQFIASVNDARKAQGLQPLTESSTPDQLAQQRFQIETEGNHWEITHYGYQDIPPGVGEVVFYPDGLTPSDYASNIQMTAPLHWNLLMDSSFSTFGFHLGQGTTLGVYQPCSATELPGLGINVTQWSAQHGHSRWD